MNSSKDIIVAGDFNQLPYSKYIENFLIYNGLFEIHNLLNGDNSKNRDNTYVIGSKCIDFVAVSSEIINKIEECKLIIYNQIIYSDYRGYLFNINLERYFKMSLFDIDRVNSSQLDSRRLLHRETFVKKVEEYLQVINLPVTINQYCNKYATSEILEIIDQ